MDIEVFEMSDIFEYKVADGRSTPKTRRKIERKHIRKHKPKLNKSRGGGRQKTKKEVITESALN